MKVGGRVGVGIQARPMLDLLWSSPRSGSGPRPFHSFNHQAMAGDHSSRAVHSLPGTHNHNIPTMPVVVLLTLSFMLGIVLVHSLAPPPGPLGGLTQVAPLRTTAVTQLWLPVHVSARAHTIARPRQAPLPFPWASDEVAHGDVVGQSMYIAATRPSVDRSIMEGAADSIPIPAPIPITTPGELRTSGAAFRAATP